jgi:hypothetical protein
MCDQVGSIPTGATNARQNGNVTASAKHERPPGQSPGHDGDHSPLARCSECLASHQGHASRSGREKQLTNPFAPQVPAEQPAQQQAPAAANPFAAPASAPPAQQPQQQYAPAPAQQQTPATPNPFAGPTAGAYSPAVAPQHAPAPAPVRQQAPAGPPPALGQAVAAGAPIAGGGKGASLADMYGRLVMFFPLKLETVQRNPQFITDEQRRTGNVTQERLTATVVVLDDGQGGMQPIAWGGKPYALPATPHTNSDPLPYLRQGMWINQTQIIGQLSGALPQGPGAAPGIVVGRVTKRGPAQNDPWYLITATEQEVALANQYLQLVASGTYPHPLA